MVPGATTTVNFSASGATNQSAMTLGSNMSILGLVQGDTSSPVTLNADGNTLTLGTGGITSNSGATALTINAPIALGASQTWTNNSTNGITVNGTISGSGFGITTTGTGSVTLSGLNTYTGATTVSQGTLNLNYTTNPTNVIAATSALKLGGGNLGGGNLVLVPSTTANTTQTFASTTLSVGSSTIVAPTGGSNNTVLNLGAITTNTGGTLNLTLPSGTASTSNGIVTTTTNVSYQNNQTTLPGNITVGGTTWAVSGSGGTAGVITGLPLASYSSSVGTHDINLDFPIGASTTISGDWYNSWRFNNAGSYTVTVGSSSIGLGNGGILETSNVGANTITINGPGTGNTSNAISSELDLDIIQNNTAGSMILNTVIYSNGGVNIVKAGPGTVVLTQAAATSMTGITTIDGGTLQLGNGGVNGTNGALNTMAVVDNANLAFYPVSAGQTFTNAISGVGTVTVLGNSVTLSGANTYTGGTIVSAGTLTLGAANILGGSTAPLSVASGATLALGSFAETVGAVSFTNATVSTGTLTGTSFNVTNGGTISTALAGTGAALTVTSGTLALTGANTYTGGTSISGSTVNVSGSGTLGATTNNLSLTNSTLTLGGTSQTAAAVTFGNSTISGGTITGTSFTSTGGTVSAVLAGSGATLTNTSGVLALSGTNTFTGATLVNGGTINVSNASGLATTASVSIANGAALNYRPTSLTPTALVSAAAPRRFRSSTARRSVVQSAPRPRTARCCWAPPAPPRWPAAPPSRSTSPSSRDSPSAPARTRFCRPPTAV